MLSAAKERGQGGASNLGGAAAGVSPAGESVSESEPAQRPRGLGPPLGAAYSYLDEPLRVGGSHHQEFLERGKDEGLQAASTEPWGHPSLGEPTQCCRG